MVNLLFFNATYQLLTNLIHWALGVFLLIYAYNNYRHRQNKDYAGGHAWLATIGLIFLLYVYSAYTLYYRKWFWPWQFDPEQTRHLEISVIWLLGGALALLAKRTRLPDWLTYVAPLAIVLGGLGFALPHQHNSAVGHTYLLDYHYVLGALLAGLAVVIVLYRKLPHIGSRLGRGLLVISLLPGFFFLTYRQPSEARAVCFHVTSTKAIDVSKFDQAPITVHLCQRIVFKSPSANIEFPSLGEHTHHAHYPNFSELPVNKNLSNSFVTTLIGTYEVHDHVSGNVITYLHIVVGPESKTWPVHHY